MTAENEFPVYRQRERADCGFCCLNIIALYYGIEVNEERFRNSVETRMNGVSLEDISKYAQSIGFDTLPVRIDFEKLRAEAPLPLIAWVDRKHYTVVFKIDDSFVYVSDPAFGLAKYELAKFVESWAEPDNSDFQGQGVALLLQPCKIDP